MLMKIKQVGIIEKYVKIVLYSQQAPMFVTHVDIPSNAIVDGIYIISDPNVMTHVQMDTSAGFGGYRDFDCSGYESCEFYTPAIAWRLCYYSGRRGEGDEESYNGDHNGDQAVFDARITHIEAYASGINPENRSILLIRLLCIGECEPRVWTESRSAL
jgi:hypothetical protein